MNMSDRIGKIIKKFNDNTSSRRRIDSKFYSELLWLEEHCRSNKIRLIEDEETHNDNKEKRKEIEEKGKLEKTLKLSLNKEGLVINEFNLYWRQNLVLGDYRNWAKRKMQLKYKNEMLNCEALEELFWRNYREEYDWKKSLNFITNREEVKRNITNR